MATKSLAFGIVGFLIGGLVVSIAATQLNENQNAMMNGSEMTMSQMSENLKNKTGDDFDEVFISSMIEHHQGAIDMAELAQKNAKHSEIKKMADDIISAQSNEINMMKTWQTEWGYESTPASRNSGH
jgi:uncharacterized protein (DUF305 family)